MNSTNWPAPNVWVFIELQNEYTYENKKANKKLHQTQQQINFTQRKTRKKELEKKIRNLSSHGYNLQLLKLQLPLGRSYLLYLHLKDRER